jgi:hypothetical protein
VCVLGAVRRVTRELIKMQGKTTIKINEASVVSRLQVRASAMLLYIDVVSEEV